MDIVDLGAAAVPPLAAAEAADLAEQRVYYDTSPCGYCTLDLRGRVLRINQTALDWLGEERSAVVGRSDFRELLTRRSQQDFEVAKAWFEKKQRLDGFEFTFRHPSGKCRTVHTTATPIFATDGSPVAIRVVMYDISEMQALKADLVAANLEQAAMLNSDLVGIMRVRQRRIVWKNRSLERMLGYAHDDLLGQSTEVLYADDETFAAVGRDGYDVVDEGGTWRTQVRMRHKAGHIVWVDLNGARLSASTDESLWMLLDITALKQHQEQVEHIAFHDALTGLPNRALLADRLRQALHAAARAKTRVAVCFLDLDGFKPVNDLYGHAAGDQLLRELGTRLEQSVRATDTVARLGGDEFVVVTAVPDRDSVDAVLNRILAAIAQPVQLGAASARVTGSIGVALFPDQASDADGLLRLADAAMYRAKRAGKSRYALSEPADLAG